MATRIDHTNCSHPRTPAGRAACRRDTYLRDAGIDTSGYRDEGNRGVIKAKDEWLPATVVPGCTNRNQACTINLCLCNDHDGAGTRAANRARQAMKRADDKVRVVTSVQDLPMPKLTPAQLDSPIFQSLLHKREV